jgi:hypothetical protein
MTGCISPPLPLYSQTSLSFTILSHAVASLTRLSLACIPRTHRVATRKAATGLVYFWRMWGLVMASLRLFTHIISTVVTYAFSVMTLNHPTQ